MKTSSKHQSKPREGLLKSIFTAYFIVLFHVLILAVVGLVVVLFKGIYQYLPWIMGAIGLAVAAIAVILYRKLSQSSGDLKEILSSPQFQDRTIEVRLLGGAASFTIKPSKQGTLSFDGDAPTALIESSRQRIERKLIELNELYQKNLICKQEYEEARHRVLS